MYTGGVPVYTGCRRRNRAYTTDPGPRLPEHQISKGLSGTASLCQETPSLVRFCANPSRRQSSATCVTDLALWPFRAHHRHGPGRR